MVGLATDRNPGIIEKVGAVGVRFAAMVKKRNGLLRGTYMLGGDENQVATEFLVENQTPDKYRGQSALSATAPRQLTPYMAARSSPVRRDAVVVPRSWCGSDLRRVRAGVVGAVE